MKKILKLTVILFIVCAIVAGVLGVVNELTKDRIAELMHVTDRKVTAKKYPEERRENHEK